MCSHHLSLLLIWGGARVEPAGWGLISDTMAVFTHKWMLHVEVEKSMMQLLIRSIQCDARCRFPWQVPALFRYWFRTWHRLCSIVKIHSIDWNICLVLMPNLLTWIINTKVYAKTKVFNLINTHPITTRKSASHRYHLSLSERTGKLRQRKVGKISFKIRNPMWNP